MTASDAKADDSTIRAEAAKEDKASERVHGKLGDPCNSGDASTDRESGTAPEFATEAEISETFECGISTLTSNSVIASGAETKTEEGRIARETGNRQLGFNTTDKVATAVALKC
jgi:hypothetical protein